MKIKGAIFDMDGTIVDSLMFWDHLYRRIGEKYMGSPTFRPSAEVDRRLRTMIYTDAMAYFKEYYGIPAATDEFLRFAQDGVTDFYERVARPKAGAEELLEYLRAKNIKICLASATEMRYVTFALECYDMRKYFDFVLSCADIGIGKDRPDIYIDAMERLELSPSDICVFEDSCVALLTAKKAGFRTVGVYDRYSHDQEKIMAESDVYLSKDRTLSDLICEIDA